MNLATILPLVTGVGNIIIGSSVASVVKTLVKQATPENLTRLQGIQFTIGTVAISSAISGLAANNFKESVAEGYNLVTNMTKTETEEETV